MSTSIVVSYLFIESNILKRYVGFSILFEGEDMPYGDYGIWGSSFTDLRKAEAWLAEQGIDTDAISVDNPRAFAGALRRIQKLRPWQYPINVDRMPEPYD